MHGLVNRAIQSFIRDTYGTAAWFEVTGAAGLGRMCFEAMLVYDPELTEQILAAAAETLNRPRPGLLEDLGTYLVSSVRGGAPRRLLRFTGERFEDFLFALEDLPDRVALAVPDLQLPAIRVERERNGRVTLRCGPELPGFHLVLGGMVRAMADDYGTLVTIRAAEQAAEVEVAQHGPSVFGGQEFRLARALS